MPSADVREDCKKNEVKIVSCCISKYSDRFSLE